MAILHLLHHLNHLDRPPFTLIRTDDLRPICDPILWPDSSDIASSIQSPVWPIDVPILLTERVILARICITEKRIKIKPHASVVEGPFVIVLRGRVVIHVQDIDVSNRPLYGVLVRVARRNNRSQTLLVDHQTTSESRVGICAETMGFDPVSVAHEDGFHTRPVEGVFILDNHISKSFCYQASGFTLVFETADCGIVPPLQLGESRAPVLIGCVCRPVDEIPPGPGIVAKCIPREEFDLDVAGVPPGFLFEPFLAV
ncbi:hypothetical protein BJX66DRAFT_266991 [Aspergillus keveii]|uniref:Uncharacterized protein n=1 Tax=Aspergillus keveii TaxID=714993 RepID=A0ABR4FYI6_9EURO